MRAASGRVARAGVLLRLDARRLRRGVSRPVAGALAAVLLPAALLVGILWVVGSSNRPEVADAEAAVLLGLLVAGPLAFLAYGTLFRAADEGFLRRLGLPARTVFAERAVRFLALALLAAAVAVIPFLAGGSPLVRPAAAALAAALAAWGAGLASAALSAQGMARKGKGGWGLLAIGIWDAEVARIAPLLYAPLLPFLSGAAAAGFVGASAGSAVGRLAVVLVASVALALSAARPHARALPRFAPQALEMSFEPPPAAAGEMTTRRGLGRLMSRRAATVWIRDGVVIGRRFGWARRIVWPIALVGFVALARWGEQPATRGWVAATALLALLLQALAAVGLGRLERQGRRWIDRSVGISWPHRLLGRWSWGFGSSLWLTVPLALAWGWWSGAGGAWLWVGAGAAAALVGSGASLFAAGWR